MVHKARSAREPQGPDHARREGVGKKIRLELVDAA
jgi:hypothetical protein